MCGANSSTKYTPLQSVARIEPISTPTEVDHYQIRRKLDIYARPSSENLGAAADYVHDLAGWSVRSLPESA